MEYKFRAWDREREEFIYSDKDYEANGEAWFEFVDGSIKAFALHGMTSGGIHTPPEPNCEELETPQMWTGLKDRNGTDIYEGDIYQEYKTNDYNEKIFGPRVVEWDINCWTIPRMSWLCEVIGNIYEGEHGDQ